ncbi:hypothetical protein CONLIGDRAFT_688480 [Coniochaeta ligniaria NRRL 30616]|uniref:Lysine-specific metallo-endopeptidase domain-containing protein n=1 Tax=Coniochaeta ligniaria NRRL 30616 TaxID=1408157 RepID=A0A1J7J468_9PEZI|nr:hypothetical protein CONLIGDRAFT_688480 [Coniochaeta ligniaria NRRL 30616]
MTPTSSLFKTLIAAVVIGHCGAAVTWTAVGCQGVTLGGQSIDTIWDNARDMSQNAASVIGKLVAANAIIPRSDTSRVANNAESLFGIDFGFTMMNGLPSAAQTTMNTVRGVFDGIVTQMQADNGYLWCGDNSFVYQSSLNPDNPAEKAYQYRIPGSNDVIVLAGYTALGITPCSGRSTLGETLRGVFRTPNAAGGTQEANVVGIILCVNALQSQIQDKGWKAVLPLGYDTGPSSKPGPDPDSYNSVSGTILHEMVHFLDWNQYLCERRARDGLPLCSRGHSRSGCGNRRAYLKNPDNYRVFAEMCMSPGTRWGAALAPSLNGRRRAARSRRYSAPAAVEEKAGPMFLGPRDSPLLELEVRNASLVQSN